MTLTASSAAVTGPADWPTLRTPPPGVSQQIFRACLDALSRPGTVTRMPRDELPTPVPAVIAPLLALSDLMTPIAGVDPTGTSTASDAVALVARRTGAPTVTPERARLALALDETERMGELAVGSHWSPEAGALLCQRVVAVHEPAAEDLPHRWRLHGPGVRTTVDVAVAGLTSRFLELRAGLTSDFPSGIDIVLVSDTGDAVGLPRTTRIEAV